MTTAELVWNRATLERGGAKPAKGDIALASLLLAHNLAMNGGVAHAVELLTSAQMSDALDGYRYFGFDGVREVFALATSIDDNDLDLLESVIDGKYAELIPSDDTLFERFSRMFATDPASFSVI